MSNTKEIRPIDANALLDSISPNAGKMRKAIYEAPTLAIHAEQAQEIIHCEACENYDESVGVCTKQSFSTGEAFYQVRKDPDDHCKYAKKRG
jgi:hypothetical protein